MRRNPSPWIKNLLRAVVRFALKNSVSFQEFTKLGRELYIEAAQDILRAQTRVNPSRIAALTGLHRREIKSVLDSQNLAWAPTLSVPVRVLNRWEQDARFTTKDGKPRVLSFEGSDSEFNSLVASISSSLNPGTILFELERIGSVERTGRGLRMLENFHRFGADPDKAFDIVGRDFDTLLGAVDENVFRRKKLTNVHLRTEYDNIFAQDLPKIREKISDEAKEFHRRVRGILSQYDKDLVQGRSEEEAGKRVTIGTFSFTDDFLED